MSAVTRGRPRTIEYDLTRIKEFLLEGRTITWIAKYFNVGRTNLYGKLKEAGLLVRDMKYHLSNAELLDEVQVILTSYSNCGLVMLTGLLRAKGIVATRERIMQCYRTTDPERITKHLRRSTHIKRRKYNVKYAHGLWHIDTHLKLNKYKIVIHGGMDGKSRLVVYLKASVANTAEQNLEVFKEGVARYQLPLRVRADKGGENILVASFMLEKRGVNVGAFIAGKSVHNQRIERLWRDVGVQVVSMFKEVFEKLQLEGVLSANNAIHLALLHYVFIERLNLSLETFRMGWNNHGIGTENRKTPNMLARDFPLPEGSMIHLGPENLETDVLFQVNQEPDLENFGTTSQMFDCASIPVEARFIIQDIANANEGRVQDFSISAGYTEYKSLYEAYLSQQE